MAVQSAEQSVQDSRRPAAGRLQRVVTTGDATAHPARAARAFERACQLTGLSSAELARRLGPMIGKPGPLSRQTLGDWRRCRRPVPLAAFLAACELAGLRPPMIFALAAEEGSRGR